MAILRDPYVILLAILLILSLGAYLLGFLPYPVGIMVLVVLLMIQLRNIRSLADKPHDTP
jgi:hypothetical protein